MTAFWLILATLGLVLAVLPLLLAPGTITDVSNVWLEGEDE